MWKRESHPEGVPYLRIFYPLVISETRGPGLLETLCSRTVRASIKCIRLSSRDMKKIIIFFYPFVIAYILLRVLGLIVVCRIDYLDLPPF